MTKDMIKAKVLDGKLVAETVYERIKKECGSLSRPPGLATVLVGDDFASKRYVGMKNAMCSKLGFYSKSVELPLESSEAEILEAITELNSDNKIDGIIVQLPLPGIISQNRILSAIDPSKDVEGMHPLNVGRLALMTGDAGNAGGDAGDAGDAGQLENYFSFMPCTPLGIMQLLDFYVIPLKGKHVVIINHSNVVGKPLALMFLARNATVTVCHKDTENLRAHTLAADILISATGVHNLITAEMVQSGAVVIDAGISSAEGKIAGDVSPEVENKAGWLSKVPGGVGPMTVAMLMKNTLEASRKLQQGN